jgi:imidazolonepropionase-like amidohydrolase
MPYGELHAHEPEILGRYGGYTPLEAMSACTRDNAFAVGLENEVGVLAPGKLADLLVLNADPVADIRVLQGGHHLELVIKDGKIVALNGQEAEADLLAFTAAAE